MPKVTMIQNGPEHSDLNTDKTVNSKIVTKVSNKKPNYNNSVVSTKNVTIEERVGKKELITNVPVSENNYAPDKIIKIQKDNLYKDNNKPLKNVHPNVENKNFSNIRNPVVLQNEETLILPSNVPGVLEYHKDKRNYKLTPDSIFVTKEDSNNIYKPINEVYENTYNKSVKKNLIIYNNEIYTTNIDDRAKFSNNKLNTYTEYGPTESNIPFITRKGDLPEPAHIQSLELL